MIFHLSPLFLVCILSGIFTRAEPITGKDVTRVKEGRYSYIVSLEEKSYEPNKKETFFCTGVLITNQFVLTAAHCLDDRLLNETQIIVGSVDRRKGKKFDLSMWITYHQWAESKNIIEQDERNDIAIVKLSRPVNSRRAKPASLSFAERNYDLNHDHVLLLGWGPTSKSPDQPSRYLQEAQVKVLPNGNCENLWFDLFGTKLRIHNKYMCTKGKAFLADGDSGGPVMWRNYVVGINRSTCPGSGTCELPEVVINNYKFNIHTIIGFYKKFIVDVLNNY